MLWNVNAKHPLNIFKIHTLRDPLSQGIKPAQEVMVREELNKQVEQERRLLNLLQKA